MQGGMLPSDPRHRVLLENIVYSEIQFRTANQGIRSLPYCEPEASRQVIILDPDWLFRKRCAAAVCDSLVFVLAVQDT